MRKNPPFTRLEVLSKRWVWLVTCWPFLLAILVLLIDTNKVIHKTSLTFSPTHCESPLQCYVSNSSPEGGIGSESASITFTLPMQAILLQYVNLIGRLKFQIPTADASFKEKSISLTYQVALNLYAVDSLGQKTQSFVQDYHMSKEVEVAVIGGEDASSLSFEYDYELTSASMERPWLLPESRNIQGVITITVFTHRAGATDDSQKASLEEKNLYNLLVQDFSHNVLYGSLFELEYQRELFSFIRSLCQLGVSVFCCLYLMDYIHRLAEYHRILYSHSVLPIFAPIAPVDSSPNSVHSRESIASCHKDKEEWDIELEKTKKLESTYEKQMRGGHYQYESLHSGVNGEDRGRGAHSRFLFRQSSSSSVGSNTSNIQNDDSYEACMTKNIEKSPAMRFSFLSFLLAEQIYTVQLLLCLFFWTDPFGALVVLLPLSSSVTVSETALWLSEFSKSSAQQGLYFTLLLFLTSLGTVPHKPIKTDQMLQFEKLLDTKQRGSRKISAVELNGHHDDQDSSHELSWLSPTKHCQFQSQYPHSDASRLSSSSTHTNSSSATEVQHSRFSSGNTHASYPSSDLSLSSSPPTLYSSHLPGWALEPDSKQANNRHNNCLNLTDKRALQNGIDPSVSIATVGDDRAHPAWLYSPTTSSEISLQDQTPHDTVAESAQATGVEVLCRTYIDTSREDEADLISSHPSSSHFFSFFIYKFLFYLLCLIIVALQIFVTYPSLYSKLRLTMLDKFSALVVEKVLYVALSAALVACRLSWIANIYKATISSALKLKETKYMTSRYQQLAFRLFVNQILVGLFLLLLSYAILVWRSAVLVYHGYKHDLAPSDSFDNLQSKSSFGGGSVTVGEGRKWISLSSFLHDLCIMANASFEAGFGVWGGKHSEIGELLYVACICFTIAFLFAPPRYEEPEAPHPEEVHPDDDGVPPNNIYLQANLGLAGHFYHYDVLEIDDDYFDVLNASASVPESFCLETALLLMEMSWQSYYVIQQPEKSSNNVRQVVKESVPARQRSNETQPLLNRDTSATPSENEEEKGYFSNLLGSTLMPQMDVAQYGMHVIKGFSNRDGDITGYMATDNYHRSRIILAFRGTADATNMLTDLNFLQTTLDRDTFNLNTKFVQDLVAEVFEDLQNVSEAQEQAKKKKEEMKRRKLSKAAPVLSTNPFDSDFDICGGMMSTSSVLESASNADKRKSLNPFDEGYASGGDCGGNDVDAKDIDKIARTTNTGDDNLKHHTTFFKLTADALSNSSLRSKSSPCFTPPTPANNVRVTLPPPPVSSTPRPSCPPPCCFESLTQRRCPRVHSGFYQAYLSVRLEVFKALIVAITHCIDAYSHDDENEWQKPLHIHICGHSLGGSLATLASLDLSLNLKNLMRTVQKRMASRKQTVTRMISSSRGVKALPLPRVLVYTYGAPRVGNRAFASWVNRQVPSMFRVEVDGDLVCRLPHVMYTCGSYHHAGTHVLIAADHTGNLMINPNVVEKQFLRRGRGTSDHHSLNQYRACFESCFSAAELHYFVSKYYMRGKHMASSSHAYTQARAEAELGS